MLQIISAITFKAVCFLILLNGSPFDSSSSSFDRLRVSLHVWVCVNQKLPTADKRFVNSMAKCVCSSHFNVSRVAQIQFSNQLRCVKAYNFQFQMLPWKRNGFSFLDASIQRFPFNSDFPKIQPKSYYIRIAWFDSILNKIHQWMC